MNGLVIERRAESWSFQIDRADVANALSAELVEALIDAVEQAHAAGAKVLCFRGLGRNFCSGFDFSGFEAESEADLLQRFVRIELLLQAIASSPCLTVAFGHGANVGAGVDLFAACRWRICDPDATFRMPGLAFGVVLGTRRFAELVGREAARDILERLGSFDAAAAQSLGFVRRVCASDQWPSILEEAHIAARALTSDARRQLYAAIDDRRLLDLDLANLVRSAAVPGLKQRMRDYRSTQRRR